MRVIRVVWLFGISLASGCLAVGGCVGDGWLDRMCPVCELCPECSSEYLLTVDQDLNVEVNWPDDW